MRPRRINFSNRNGFAQPTILDQVIEVSDVEENGTNQGFDDEGSDGDNRDIGPDEPVRNG